MTNVFKNILRSVQERRIYLIAALIVFVLLVAAIRWGRSELNSFFYPSPENMPPVVYETTEQLLAQFEKVLAKEAPLVLRSLQPGLSQEQIIELENKGGFRLSADLRKLYQWRDGMKNKRRDLIPVYRFVPLEEVVDSRIAIEKDIKRATFIQRIIGDTFAGHMKTWVHILDDGSGNGYFYDPQRAGTSGIFFYHSMEEGYYVFFPSLRNFLKGAIECYQQDIFNVKDNGVTLNADFAREIAVWKHFGRSNF